MNWNRGKSEEQNTPQLFSLRSYCFDKGASKHSRSLLIECLHSSLVSLGQILSIAFFKSVFDTRS